MKSLEKISREVNTMAGIIKKARAFAVFSFFVGLVLIFVSDASAQRRRSLNETSANPYSAGFRNPITWGGLDGVTSILYRNQFERHNVVVRLTKSGLNEIGELISDILSGDPSVANLVNYLAMTFLDRCTNTKVVADFWDNLQEFQEWLTNNYPNNPTYSYYWNNSTAACGITTTAPNFSLGEGVTHCFGNDIYFEYIAGYNPTGTWDEGTNQCKDDGKGLISLCLPIPLLNDEGAPICLNGVIWGQERDKRVGTSSNPIMFAMGGWSWRPFGKCGLDNANTFCPISAPQSWDPFYFLDRVTYNRLILDYKRDAVTVRLNEDIGTDYPATATCEGDLTEHTSDDRLDISVELRNFELALTFSSPYVDSQTRYVDCVWVGNVCQFNPGVTSFPNALSYCFKNRDAINDRHICDPQWETPNNTTFTYDESRVISNYVNGRVYLRIPILGLRLGIQIKGNFTDHTDWAQVVRGLGINLKGLDVIAGIAYDMIPMAASITTPACRNTAWNTVGSAQYCPEYRVSQKVARTLLWLDAVLRLIAIDNFNVSCVSGKTTVNQYDTCIAYFLFPGQVFDLKDILESLNPIEHPMEEVVYVGATTYYEHKPNKIFIDLGFTNDFWADSAGILLAMNVATDIRYVIWNSSATSLSDVKRASFNQYVTSCVQFATPMPKAATSQIIPIRECGPQTGCPPASPRTVDQCTGANNANNGQFPHVFSSQFLPQYPVAPTLAEGRYGYSVTNYYVGVGIHHNLVSRILYEVVGDGIACIWVDKYTPMLGSFAGGFLNTDSFAFFMPKLKDSFPNKEMAIEIIPNYKDPGSPSGNSGGAATYNRPLSVVAYSKTGGPTFRPVLSVYSTGSTRNNFWDQFVQNATFGSGFTMFVSPTTWFDTADLLIDLPYIDLSFNVVTTGNITNANHNWMRVFGLTVGLMLSVDIDIVPCVSPDCARTVRFPNIDSTDFSQPLTSFYRNYYTGQTTDRGGNYFPQGGTFARVIDLTLYVDPDVRYFIAYNSNALGLSGSNWAEILGNILPVVLNGLAGAKLRVALDPAALLQIPMEFNFPWVGPEFGNLPWDTAFPHNAPGATTDGIGDYFEMFIHWRGRPTFGNIVKLLNGLGIDLVDTIGSIAGLAPGVPMNVRFADYTVNGNGKMITPPETFITHTSDPSALYTRIEFSGWSPNSDKVRYSWRLDGGTWNLWSEENSVVLTHLLEGWHVFEVRAKDGEKLIDPTPAKFVFRVDSLGPDINVTAPEVVRGSKAVFFADVKDAQASADQVLVSYAVDDGEWSQWVPANELTSIELSRLSKGEHILKIKAKDDVGNISQYTHRFFVTENAGILGCSTASVSWIVFAGVMISLAIIRRRING
ncbi:MAG: hypothetical protein RMJ45_03995 [Candidatus Calescibacterium sp.]|nr:hypothetical protein [Candidatus Calescibacterium sp.]